jgi:hypothetical protein
MRASLRSFLETASLAGVGVGHDRDAVQSMLGAPPNYSVKQDSDRLPAIWRYGDAEIYFDRGRVWMVQLDFGSSAFTIPGVEFDRVDMATRPTQAQVEAIADDLGLEHAIDVSASWDFQTTVVLGGGRLKAVFDADGELQHLAAIATSTEA